MLTQAIQGDKGIAWSTVLARLAPLVVAALALGLRLYGAGAQSYWYDEGISVSLAARSLAQITADALNDIHPPFYYYVLHFWTRLAGDGEFSVRFLSAAAGTLGVCGVYALGASLFSRLAGLVAAAFVAFAPLHVYYAQEARMYALLLALTTLWSLTFLHLLSDNAAPRRRALLGRVLYVGLGVTCVYTHYFAFLLLAAHGLWVLTRGWRTPRALAGWLGAMAVVPLAFLPWALNMGWGQLNSFQQGQALLPPTALLVKMLDDFTVGHRVTADESVRLGFAILLAAGLLAALRGPARTRHGGVFAVLYLLVPVGAMLVLSLGRSAYAARLLLMATPGLYLLFGQALAGVGFLAHRTLGGTPGAAVGALLCLGLSVAGLVPLAGSLPALYDDPAWRRDDYRGAIAYVEAVAKPGDALVLDSPYQGDIVGLYYKGDRRVYPLPLGRPADCARTEAALAKMVREHGGVWALFWGTPETDPDGVVERWLDSHAFKALDRWFGGLRLAHYLVAPVGERVPLDVRFGDHIRLRGYAWQKREGTPGEVLPLTLYWEATLPPEKRYKVFVHLLDDGEKIWGQRDSEPAGGAKPTLDWRPGAEVEDRLGLPIQPDAAPGRYQVEIGLYEYPSMERPEVADAFGPVAAKRVLVGPVEVK